MINQVFEFIVANPLVIFGLVAVNGVFFTLGLKISTYIARDKVEERIAAAYRDGFADAQKQSVVEKKAFSQGVTGELAKLRDGIINSARAYRDTLQVIESRVGFSEQDRDKLLIGKAIASDPTLSLLDAPEPISELDEVVGA